MGRHRRRAGRGRMMDGRAENMGGRGEKWAGDTGLPSPPLGEHSLRSASPLPRPQGAMIGDCKTSAKDPWRAKHF